MDLNTVNNSFYFQYLTACSLVISEDLRGANPARQPLILNDFFWPILPPHFRWDSDDPLPLLVGGQYVQGHFGGDVLHRLHPEVRVA